MPDGLRFIDCPRWCEAPHNDGASDHWRHLVTRGALHVSVVQSGDGTAKASVTGLDRPLILNHDQAEALAYVLEEIGNTDFAELMHLAVRRLEDDEHEEEI